MIHPDEPLNLHKSDLLTIYRALFEMKSKLFFEAVQSIGSPSSTAKRMELRDVTEVYNKVHLEVQRLYPSANLGVTNL